MAVDVLAYNALNCRTQTVADTVNINRRTCLYYSPDNTNLWTNDVLPMCITSGTVLNVCDSSGYYRCGVCCLWTVPAGVTRAQFQLWGAGAGTGAAACCGGSLVGSTGAYAIVTIPVVAGCQYTICSGCAACCFAAMGACAADGCASFVTGYGLTNLCAEGGRAGLCAIPCNYGISRCQLMSMSSPLYPTQYAQTFQPQGFCFCNSGSNFCAAGTSCPLTLPLLVSDRSFFGNTSTAGVNVCGLPSMLTGRVCYDGNMYGYNIIPPVPTPCCATAHVTDCCYSLGGQCCQAFTSGTCGGYCCNTIQTSYTKYFTWPGQGGVPVHVMGGSCLCGDSGRMGMVKVTYC